MKRIGFVLLSLLLVALAACGGADSAATTGASASSSAAEQEVAASELAAPVVAVATAENSAVEPAAPEEAVEPAGTSNEAALSDSYGGALSIRTQLALGTLQLEETDQAVTVEQAEALLPLWQVLNTLETSGTAAEAEVDAVVKQIQNTMTGEQIAAIAAMQLTEDNLDVTALSGFGQGQRGADGGPGGGFGAGPGGGVEGGFGAGGGPGGRMGMGPGGGLGAGGGLDADAMATRQAEMAAASPAELAEQFSVNLVLRLLQTRTGDVPVLTGGLVASTLADFGLTDEQITAGLEAGHSFAEIVTSNGLDLDEVRQALVDAIEAAGELQGTEAEAAADRLLQGGYGRGQNQNQP